MTEKDYSGATTSKIGKNASVNSMSKEQAYAVKNKLKTDKPYKDEDEENTLTEEQINNYKKAAKIAKEVKDYAKVLIKPEMPLSEIAEKIEAKIIELDGEIAFPVNLSIDDVAAHYTPTLRDDKLATGLLKVDLGVHIKGFIADIAFSLDLTKEKAHAKLINASEKALLAALEIIKKSKDSSTISQIGKAIETTIKNEGFIPIANLSGHGLDEFDLHSGITIANFDNESDLEIGEGAFAIEPFSTISTGTGMIYEGAGSNIYHLTGQGQIRDNFAREVAEWIINNKKMLPFSQREIERKFGTRGIIALSNLKRCNAIREFPQLVEKSHQVVSQAETSIIIHEGKIEILVEPN